GCRTEGTPDRRPGLGVPSRRHSPVRHVRPRAVEWFRARPRRQRVARVLPRRSPLHRRSLPLMRAILKAGAIAGAAGGLALAAFLRLVGEGAIGDAVALERSRSGVHHEMFSRGTQQVGGMLGALLY